MSIHAQESRFKPHLLEGESVVWTAQPLRNIHLTRADRLLVPLSLLWEGFMLYALLREIGAEAAFRSSLSMAILLVLNLIGLYLLCGRFLYKWWRKSRTYFAITNRRAITLTDILGRLLDDVLLTNVPISMTKSGSKGAGTIKFGETKWSEETYGNTGLDVLFGLQASGCPTFFDIPNVQGVHNLLMAQMHSVVDPGNMTRLAARLRPAS
jgi:hypothetical protein